MAQSEYDFSLMREGDGVGRDSQALKKLVASLAIVGTFIVYSLSHNSSIAAMLPGKSSTGGSGVPTATTTDATPSGQYKDGTYTGSIADAQWGYVQVQTTISGGKISDVQFLQYPNDRDRSIMINSYADPLLTNEAIQAQSAQVDIITGATDSSEAFMQSLGDALAQAQA